jgi:hypothetical protein
MLASAETLITVHSAYCLLHVCRFALPPHLTLKNFEGLDLGKMDKVIFKPFLIFSILPEGLGAMHFGCLR